MSLIKKGNIKSLKSSSGFPSVEVKFGSKSIVLVFDRDIKMLKPNEPINWRVDMLVNGQHYNKFIYKSYNERGTITKGDIEDIFLDMKYIFKEN